MNTVTATTQSVLVNRDSDASLFALQINKRWPIWLMASVAFFSALSLVYVKDLNRRLFIDYQNLQAQQGQTYTKWGKLLLEQSTWATQSRIQTIAENKLDMQLPQPSQVVLVKAG